MEEEEEFDPTHHLTPEEERLWKKLKTEPNTKEDWADLDALLIAFRRRFIQRHAPPSKSAPKSDV